MKIQEQQHIIPHCARTTHWAMYRNFKAQTIVDRRKNNFTTNMQY